MVLASAPGSGVAAVRSTWDVNRATAARWIRAAITDPEHADSPTAARWIRLTAIRDGDPVPGRPYRATPIVGIPVPNLDTHDLHAPIDQPDPVTAAVNRDLDRRGDQR